MIRNEALATQVLQSIDTLIDAAQYMYECGIAGEYSLVVKTAKDMKDLIGAIYPITKEIKEEISFISSPTTCENLLYSIDNILKLFKVRSDRSLSKIEFELIPILQEFYYDFYFFTCVFGDKEKEKIHYSQEYALMGSNSYIEENMKTNQYKYDVSIYVLAYNKLEYTKQCVESIIKYTPSYINYELFFINNGSTDLTQEYFDSFQCNKGISLLKNSFADKGAVRRIVEGRYVLSISNDVIVTENYLDNLIKCIESDPKIAMVVPTTPNIANQQSIPANYSTLEEMHAFAKENNVSDPLRWEERTRLCNPLALYRSDLLLSSNGVGAADPYFVYGEFGDDALAYRIRRAGYKMILAKDCFCHHFGSVTLKEAQVKENTLEKSRALFYERHGIDAWSPGYVYDEIFLESLDYKAMPQVNILGINPGFGSNPLKIKNLHKEIGSANIKLCYVTEDERYVPDLEPFGDHVIYDKDVLSQFDNVSFDYILLETNIEEILRSSESLNKIMSKLSESGVFAARAVDDNEIQWLTALNPERYLVGKKGHWFLWLA